MANTFHEKAFVLRKARGTRWLCHKVAALEAVIHNYHLIIAHFQDAAAHSRQDISGDDKAKLRGWLRKMTDAKISVMMHFYLDVLKQLSDMSL